MEWLSSPHCRVSFSRLSGCEIDDDIIKISMETSYCLRKVIEANTYSAPVVHLKVLDQTDLNLEVVQLRSV